MTVDAHISEEEIIALLQERDPKGMRYLYDNFSGALYGVVYKIVPVAEVAEEVLQEAFVKIWHNFPQYDKNKGRLFTWMLNITRNLAIDKTRSTEYKSIAQTQTIENYVYQNTSVADDETIPEHIGLKEIVGLLRREQKELIDLIYFNGYTQAEAAEKLKIPLGTVKTRVRNAMTELRKIFQHS